MTGGPKLAANLALAVTGLGLAPLAKKAALDGGAGPLPLALATVAVAALVAGSLLLIRRGPRAPASRSPTVYLHVGLVGVLGSGAVTLLGILAMMETTATNRSLFQSMYPVATAVAARLLLGERLGAGAYWIIAAMCSGLLMMNSGATGVALGPAFWMLAATLPLIGLADVYAKKTLEDAAPGFVSAGRYAFGTLGLGLTLPFIDSASWPAVTAQWPWIVAAGTAMAAGVIGLYRAMETAGASLTAAFVALAPVTTVGAEWLLLGTAFTAAQLAGIAVVAGGAALLAYRI